VKRILARNVDVDERDEYGGTALHAAMFQENLEVAQLLIEAGFDVNAQGTSNGYTPLHDAVWSNNIEAAKLLLLHGARLDIKGKDGTTPLQKALNEGKKEIATMLETASRKSPRQYDAAARAQYSHNDVAAFVYSWFAGFDHQTDINHFTRHLNAEQVSMHFPDFPINSIADFTRWYDDVRNNIQWNSHGISNLKISGTEKEGFKVALDVRWKARTYDGDLYDVPVHQDWTVQIDPARTFIITGHKATLINQGKK